eukprot:scaffold1723_cov104-Isochrysis_galbana.AAC.8
MQPRSCKWHHQIIWRRVNKAMRLALLQQECLHVCHPARSPSHGNQVVRLLLLAVRLSTRVPESFVRAACQVPVQHVPQARGSTLLGAPHEAQRHASALIVARDRALGGAKAPWRGDGNGASDVHTDEPSQDESPSLTAMSCSALHSSALRYKVSVRPDGVPKLAGWGRDWGCPRPVVLTPPHVRRSGHVRRRDFQRDACERHFLYKLRRVG